LAEREGLLGRWRGLVPRLTLGTALAALERPVALRATVEPAFFMFEGSNPRSTTNDPLRHELG